jgi:hypothetical protein
MKISQQNHFILSDIGVFAPEKDHLWNSDAAHAFQDGIYESLGELMFQNVLVWIDDVLVYSKDF